MRILIVEDEPLIAMAVETALRERGADIRTAATDRAAYATLEASAGDLDLLITDINLREGTTGFDVSRFARRIAPNLPVIYLSGSEGSVATFGVDGALFVAKPVIEADLIGAVEDAVSRLQELRIECRA